MKLCASNSLDCKAMQKACAHLRKRPDRVKGVGEATGLGGVMLVEEVIEAGADMLGDIALAAEAIGDVV